MKLFTICTAALFSAAALTLIAADQEKHAGHGGAKSPAFEKLKALSGEWTVSGGGEHGGPGGSGSYRVTAGGGAVLETLFAGTEHEMVTLYYMDGDHLTMTHYCMLGNRPLMRAEKSSGPNKLVFKCQDGENRKIEEEDHMHQATFNFIDADHLRSEWVLYKGGKADSTHA